MANEWRAYLQGDGFDLELLESQFDGGRIRVGRDDDGVWFGSDDFDGAGDGQSALAVAEQLLREVNGAGKLIDGTYRAVRLSGVFRDGEHIHVVLTDVAELRSQALVGQVFTDEERAPNDGPKYVDRAGADGNAREVLQLLAEDHPSWVTLWKVREVLCADVGKLTKLGATDDEVRAFRGSANLPQVSGEAARHARGPAGTPKHTMTLDEGRAFIYRLAREWFSSKVAAASTPPPRA